MMQLCIAMKIQTCLKSKQMRRSEIKDIVNKVLQKTNKFEDVFTKADSIFTTQIDIKPILASFKESKRKRFNYPVEIINNFKNKSSKVELVSIFDIIRSDKFKSDQELLKRLIEDDIFLPTVYFENRKRYTPCGIFYRKTNAIGIRILNQLIILETKKNIISQSEIQIIKNDEHTFAFYRQIFPGSYILLVETINLNRNNYVEYQEKIESYYAKLLGSTKVKAINLNTSIPFSFDSELYYNIHSKQFKK